MTSGSSTCEELISISCFSESNLKVETATLSSNFSSPKALPESAVPSYSARSSKSEEDILAFTSD